MDKGEKRSIKGDGAKKEEDGIGEKNGKSARSEADEIRKKA